MNFQLKFIKLKSELFFDLMHLWTERGGLQILNNFKLLGVGGVSFD